MGQFGHNWMIPFEFENQPVECNLEWGYYLMADEENTQVQVNINPIDFTSCIMTVLRAIVSFRNYTSRDCRSSHISIRILSQKGKAFSSAIPFDSNAIRFYWHFMFVFISVPPMMMIQNQLVGAAIGQNITLECTSEAFPKSINFWMRSSSKNDSIISAGKYKELQLSFS